MTFELFFFEQLSETPLEEVTDALAGKFNSFMMTHNMDLKLPETFFDGATFRVTPRKFEGNGALVKVEFIPRTLVEARGHGTGRILFKKISEFAFVLLIDIELNLNLMLNIFIFFF